MADSKASPMSFDQPLPFVLAKKDGSLGIDQDIVNYLSKQTDKKVTVVAIVGLFRRGKSFLLNRLRGLNSGFPLGQTVWAETKGIWIWIGPHPKDKNRLLVLLDTEGLGDPMKNENPLDPENTLNSQDFRIVALSILLSSAFIYNIMGVADQHSIDYLQLAAMLTEKVKTKDTEEDESREDFAKNFPELIWVMRDIHVKLEHRLTGKVCTPNEFMESCLADKTGISKKVRNENMKNQDLRAFFAKRSCYVLPTPVSNEDDMLILDKLTESDLNPRFLAASKVFTDYVLDCVPNKTVDGQGEISAAFFASLAEQYVEAVQTEIVCIESVVDAVKAAANQKAMEGALQILEQELGKVEFPLHPERLKKILQAAYEQAREHYLKNALAIDQSDADGLREQLTARTNEFDEENRRRCAEFCKDIITTFYEHIQAGMNAGAYMVSGGHKKICKDVEDFVKKYRGEESVQCLGQCAEDELKKFLNDTVDPMLKQVLVSDASMTEKDRKFEEEKQRNEHSKRQAELKMKKVEEEAARAAETKRQRSEDEMRFMQLLFEKEGSELRSEMRILRERNQMLQEDLSKAIRKGHEREVLALKQKQAEQERKMADQERKIADLVRKQNEVCAIM